MYLYNTVKIITPTINNVNNFCINYHISMTHIMCLCDIIHEPKLYITKFFLFQSVINNKKVKNKALEIYILCGY